MSAQRIDGVALSQHWRNQARQEVAQLKEQGLTPGLAVILVGDDPASQVYVRNKVKACEELGFYSQLERYDSTITQAQLRARIQALNEDPHIHGILVQLPLPAALDAQEVIETISPLKDVDGFHVASAGALMVGQEGFWPCTPHGCIKMLEHVYQVPSGGSLALQGKHAVIVGRSNIVGKPMAMMLLRYHATVTICHSGTHDLPFYTRQADILIAAVGQAALIKADMVKKGAVVIDVGINRDSNGKLCGDVDFDGVSQVASHITPVPGGVGPMTITMLLLNTLDSARRHLSLAQTQ